MAFDDFKAAQASASSGYEAAKRELQSGRKTGHWIWYVFPQLAGLGSSSMARAYALADVREAVDYLRDPVLGARLVELTGIVARQIGTGVAIVRLMGSEIDALKLVSSLTLFELAAQRLGRSGDLKDLRAFTSDCAAVLASAEQQGYPRCAYTRANAGC